MVKQVRVSISGLASSGKNTLADILEYQIWKHKLTDFRCTEQMAFATPIKTIAQIMFPDLPSEYLFGSSEFRNQIIPGAIKDNQPLTVRQLLLDIGTSGRLYNENIWIDNFDSRLKKLGREYNVIICQDVRFRNEFEYLKKKKFFQIRLYRETNKQLIDHISEVGQKNILDDEFDYILDNNKSLAKLKREVKTQIIPLLKCR